MIDNGLLMPIAMLALVLATLLVGTIICGAILYAIKSVLESHKQLRLEHTGERAEWRRDITASNEKTALRIESALDTLSDSIRMSQFPTPHHPTSPQTNVNLDVGTNQGGINQDITPSRKKSK